MKTVRTLGIALLFALSLGLAGCADDCDNYTTLDMTYCDDDEETCTPAPQNCRKEAGGEARLEMHFSKPLPVRVRVYRGSFYESGKLVWDESVNSEKISVPLLVGIYSATALYVQARGDSVLVVDRGTLSETTTSWCEGSCFETENGDVDLRLR